MYLTPRSTIRDYPSFQPQKIGSPFLCERLGSRLRRSRRSWNLRRSTMFSPVDNASDSKLIEISRSCVHDVCEIEFFSSAPIHRRNVRSARSDVITVSCDFMKRLFQFFPPFFHWIFDENGHSSPRWLLSDFSLSLSFSLCFNLLLFFIYIFFYPFFHYTFFLR